MRRKDRQQSKLGKVRLEGLEAVTGLEKSEDIHELHRGQS
jgi:hypothetical protein